MLGRGVGVVAVGVAAVLCFFFLYKYLSFCTLMFHFFLSINSHAYNLLCINLYSFLYEIHNFSIQNPSDTCI